MAKRHRARTGRLGRSFMNADDFRFLDELYYATNGSAWDNSVGWDRRHEHPLGCTGVTAAAASGEEGKGDEAIHRLSGLDLRGNNLRWVTNFPVLSPAERGVLVWAAPLLAKACAAGVLDDSCWVLHWARGQT